MVVVKESSIHGKGAFALKDFMKDEILECDVLEITKSPLVENYIFPFIGSRVCIHVGWASFINSSPNPNLQHLIIDTKTKISYFKVVQKINVGEELTLRY